MPALTVVATETKSLKGAATRDQILDAAARLIHIKGYHATSLDDVLRESGVGKGNFYYYFKSKEDLGHAILDRATRALVERSLGSGADPLLPEPGARGATPAQLRRRLRHGQSRLGAVGRARGLP
jgi:AcrR family transcriptional regulator